MAGDRVRRLLDPGRDTTLGLAIRAGRRYLGDGMPDRAASIAYYGMLSVFPALLIAAAVVDLFGGVTTPGDLADYARDRGASDSLSGALRDAAATAQGFSGVGGGLVGLVGLGTLIYGASRTFTATGRALDVMGGRAPVPRSLKRRLQDIGWTLVLVILGTAAILLVSVSGRLLRDVLGLLGLSGIAATAWSLARLPIAAALAFVVVAVVRRAAPTAGHARLRFFSLGAVVTVASFFLSTLGYALYVAEIATYNATYGAFAGAVILLLWIWLGAGALLYGAELDAVRDAARRE